MTQTTMNFDTRKRRAWRCEMCNHLTRGRDRCGRDSCRIPRWWSEMVRRDRKLNGNT